MQKLFYPKSIVIFGLSSKPSNIPRLSLENSLRWGYKGKIFGINPRAEKEYIDGIRIYKNLDELPEVPDLAFCMVPAKFVPGIVEDCGRFGIKRLAIPAGGFSEYSEEGENYSDQIVEIAKQYEISFVGPNCLTVANTENGLCLPFVSLHKIPKGNVSIISQSGGFALTLLYYFETENIGLSKFASIGNKLNLDEVDFLEYFGRDPKTGVIFIYLESLKRGKEFIETAKKIDKPILVYKAGITQAGEKIAMSHTAAISNNDDIIDSAFEEAGIIRIHNFLDFIEVSKAFQLPPMKGRRIMAMSPGGGFSVSAADLCEKAGFEFANLEDEFYENLKKLSSADVVNFSNPLDMGTIYDPEVITHVFHTIMHSDQVDGAVFISQSPDMPPPRSGSIFHQMLQADFSLNIQGTMLSTAKPFGICLLGSNKLIQDIKDTVPYPVFNNPESLINVLAIQQKYYEQKKAIKKKEKLKTKKDEVPQNIDHKTAGKWINEKEGDYGEEVLELLTSYGIPVAASKISDNKEEAINFAREIGFPVVMKLVSPDTLHKSEAGGVIVDVKQPGEVEKSFELIRNNLDNYDKNARFDGVRIQKMAPEGYDMFVGGKHDPSFGPVVFFGMGGIYIEVFKDTTSVLCPAEKENIENQLKRLKSYEILKGTRGKSPADIESFVDLIKRISLLLAEHPRITELDINPVRVFSNENGVMALDARARIDPAAIRNNNVLSSRRII